MSQSTLVVPDDTTVFNDALEANVHRVETAILSDSHKDDGCIAALPPCCTAAPLDAQLCFLLNSSGSMHTRCESQEEEADQPVDECIATTRCNPHPTNVCNGGVAMRVFDGCKPLLARHRNAPATERTHVGTIICVFDGVPHPNNSRLGVDKSTNPFEVSRSEEEKVDG